MPDFSKIWATNSPLPEYTFTDSEYLTGWDFVAAAPPTKNQFDAWFRATDEKLKWLYDKLNDTANAIYPVGAVYISFNSTSPSSLFGGTWQRLKDTFLLANGDSYAPNTTGGSATKTIAVSNMPSHNHSVNASTHNHSITTSGAGSHAHSATASTVADHTHKRGTMNITGSFVSDGLPRPTGAFTLGAPTQYISGDVEGSVINFDASKTWVGETEPKGSHTHAITVISVGNHTHTVTVSNGGYHTHTTNNTGGSVPLNIMPPYQTVYMWRRMA